MPTLLEPVSAGEGLVGNAIGTRRKPVSQSHGRSGVVFRMIDGGQEADKVQSNSNSLNKGLLICENGNI